MFRDGLLSPRSKLLPGGGSAPLSLYSEDGANVKRADSVLSVASTGTFSPFNYNHDRALTFP